MWIALYIHVVHGRFDPYGPFDTKQDAERYIEQQKVPALWVVKQVAAP